MSAGEFFPKLPDRSQPFQASQRGTGNSSQHHEADRWPDSDELPKLHQDEQLEEWNPYEKKEKAAEQRHGGKYPSWNHKGPEGSRTCEGLHTQDPAA